MVKEIAKVKVRESGIELLRILAMLGIDSAIVSGIGSFLLTAVGTVMVVYVVCSVIEAGGKGWMKLRQDVFAAREMP